MFSEFMTDVLTLKKPDGRTFDNIPACVSGKGIMIEDVSLPIECGDTLTRALPNGLGDTFVVDDPGFHQAFATLAAHFQVKVHKVGTAKATTQPVTYNVSGTNARVNINSHDYSTNSMTFSPAPVFGELRDAVSNMADEHERAKLLTGIEIMEKAHGTPTFLTRYTDFISLAANSMTLIAPFLPELAKLVTG